MKDLHIHTKYSDGEYDEKQILQKISKTSIEEFAICDHDTLTGSIKVNNLIKENNINIKFHTGVELSCILYNMFKGVNCHILVYDFDYNNQDLLNLIDEISEKRRQKIQLMIDKVKEIYNVDIPITKIKRLLKQTNSVGKPHIYSILCEYGNFDREEYYEKMRGLKSYNLKLDTYQVLEKLKNYGCKIVLAHPKEIMEEHNLTYEDIDKIIKILKPIGLTGLETKSSKHTKDDIKKFEEIANKNNLIKTGGSDYHGEHVKPNVLLGVCEKI